MKRNGGAGRRQVESEFADLYERMWPRLVSDLARAFGSRATAEECVQQAFEKAWKSWGGDEIRNRDAWITRIAVNVARDRMSYDKLRLIPEILRRFGRGHEATVDPEAAIASPLYEAIRKLPEIDRLVVIWHFQQGLSEAQIAERLGRSVRMVELRISRSREKLRAELFRDGNEWRISPPPAVEGKDAT